MNIQSCQLVSLSRRRTPRWLLAALCWVVLATLAQAQVVPGTAGHNWVDTGLDIAPGTLVTLSATGEVDVRYDWGVHGPRGTTRFARGGPYPSASGTCRYGLVARLTRSRTSPIPISGLFEDWSFCDAPVHCAERGGHLWLTVNDDDPSNNLGEFTVRVSQTPCRPPVERGRFRVAIVMFKVVRQTLDDLLHRDGRGDEVFFQSQWSVTEPGRQTVTSQIFQSLVMGDTEGHSGRIAAGTTPPRFGFRETEGGLKNGDVVPRNEMPSPLMQLFDDQLTADQVLVVESTIWEHDDGSVPANRTFDTVTGASSVLALPDPEHSGLLGRILATGGVLGTRVRVGLNVFGDPQPRPIGMTLGQNSYVFVPQRLRFTLADANEASRTDFGYGNGVVLINYRDNEALKGDYELFVRIERL